MLRNVASNGTVLLRAGLLLGWAARGVGLGSSCSAASPSSASFWSAARLCALAFARAGLFDIAPASRHWPVFENSWSNKFESRGGITRGGFFFKRVKQRYNVDASGHRVTPFRVPLWRSLCTVLSVIYEDLGSVGP